MYLSERNNFSRMQGFVVGFVEDERFLKVSSSCMLSQSQLSDVSIKTEGMTMYVGLST